MEISHRSKKKGSCNYPFFVLLSLHFLSSHLRMIWLITLAMIEVTMEIITSTGIHLLPVVRRLSDNVYIVTQQRIWIEKSIKCIILHFNVKYISVCRYENRPSESWGFRVSLRMSGHDETQKFRRKWRVIMPCSLLIKGKYSDKKVEIILNKG